MTSIQPADISFKINNPERDITMYKNDDRCPICGAGTLKKNVIDEIFEYKNQTITIPDYVIYECNECEEAIVDKETLKTSEKVIRDFHKRVDGLLTSD